MSLVLVVDADTHIEVRLTDLAAFMAEPYRSHVEMSPPDRLLPHAIGDQTVGGRIRRPFTLGASARAPHVEANVEVVFPDELLGLGQHPNPRFEAAVADAYARWLTEFYLPAHPRSRGVLVLPVGDAEAARRLVVAYGGNPHVVGALLSDAQFVRVHDNRFAKLYATLQDHELALAFHPNPLWTDRPFPIFDRFLPVWAVGNPFNQSIHLINWVLNGMSIRFPRLRCVFYEAGVCWLTFIAHRLDQEFLRRPSEAPLLQERPSHYIQRCYFSTQPLDQMADQAFLEPPMRLVGTDHFVYASNFPRWDFDLPEVIRGLEFLNERERQAILGGNAMRLFAIGNGASEIAKAE